MKLFKKEEQNKISIDYLDPYADINLADYISSLIKQYGYSHWVILCIGTDRSTGDSLGPLVGSRLKLNETDEFTVLGSLDEPIHALNLNETINLINEKYPNSGVIAIDASLGQLASVGTIQVHNKPLKPGAGVKKDLPEVGHFHITGIVNIGGFMEYFVLQNTRLSIVMKMSEIISFGLLKTISNLQIKKENVVND